MALSYKKFGVYGIGSIRSHILLAKALRIGGLSDLSRSY